MATLLIEPVAKLIEAFNRLPGIGPKTAQRLTYHLLRAPDGEARDARLGARRGARRGRVLRALLQHQRRAALPDLPRPGSRPVAAVRRRGAARRPGPRADRRVPRRLPRPPRRDLADRRGRAGPTARSASCSRASTRPAESAPFVEVILATNPTLEGEATAMYLDERLAGKVGSVTRIARGHPGRRRPRVRRRGDAHPGAPGPPRPGRATGVAAGLSSADAGARRRDRAADRQGPGREPDRPGRSTWCSTGPLGVAGSAQLALEAWIAGALVFLSWRRASSRASGQAPGPRGTADLAPSRGSRSWSADLVGTVRRAFDGQPAAGPILRVLRRARFACFGAGCTLTTEEWQRSRKQRMCERSNPRTKSQPQGCAFFRRV